MAFTVPRTWTDGELVTKAIMDPHIRDNFLSMGPHLIVRKPSDETISSNAVLQDDNDLLMSVGASEVWQFSFNIIYSSNVTADLKFAFTQPAAGKISGSGVAFGPTLATIMTNINGDTGSPTANNILGGAAVATPIFHTFNGIWTGGGTAGTLRLQWAQNASDAGNTTVHANSTLWAVKLV